MPLQPILLSVHFRKILYTKTAVTCGSFLFAEKRVLLERKKPTWHIILALGSCQNAVAFRLSGLGYSLSAVLHAHNPSSPASARSSRRSDGSQIQ